MSFEKKNYYERLGVARDATDEQIKEAYREIARVYHPDSKFYEDVLKEADRSDHLSDRDIETFRLVTEAYNTLTSESRRKKYDEMLVASVAWRTPGTTGQISKEKAAAQELSSANQVRVRVMGESERKASFDGPSPVVRSVAEMIQEQRASSTTKKKPVASNRVKMMAIIFGGLAVLAIVALCLLLLL